MTTPYSSLLSFNNVSYKGTIYNISCNRDADRDLFVCNHPLSPGTTDNEIKMYIYQRDDGYRYGYLAHFFYLSKKKIVKRDLFQTLVPNGTWPDSKDADAIFARNVMDILIHIAAYYQLNALTLQDEAKNEDGFPLCDNRFRANTYIGTYEKYGFIRDNINYRINNDDRGPTNPKSIEMAVAFGNQEIDDDMASAHHAIPKPVEMAKPYTRSPSKRSPPKRSRDLDVEIQPTLESVVSDYYTGLKNHEKKTKLIPPPPCFGGRIKYFQPPTLAGQPVQTVVYTPNVSPVAPTGRFAIRDLIVTMHVQNGILILA